jgi:hypothetical protein
LEHLKKGKWIWKKHGGGSSKEYHMYCVSEEERERDEKGRERAKEGRRGLDL